MSRFLTSALFFSCFSGGLGFVKWDGLHVTWCPVPSSDPEHCLQSIPKTVSEAETSGWHELKTNEGCTNNGKFHGRRFIKGDDVALSPLYDINGIIAGIQMNLRKDELFATENPYKYGVVPEFLDNVINGHPAYSLTLYYVNPKRICTIGRSKHQLRKEGTGTGLWIQAGPNTHEHNLIRVPLYRDAAIQRHWSDNLCVDTMGHHNYYDVPHIQETNCTIMGPIFLIYNNDGELHGYGGVGVGKLSSLSFEHPPEPAIYGGLGSMTPPCMAALSNNPQYSNMHMFLIADPQAVKCKPLVQAEHGRDIYTKGNAKPLAWWQDGFDQ